LHSPQPSLVTVENSHNSAGGTVWQLDELTALVRTARELGLAAHLDGARLANAAVAIGRPAAEIGRLFDTVTLCFSKGLGAPLGAVIAGSHELMDRARVEKHRFGGAMRQAGIVAAAGLYALEHNVDRLAEDHARARRLAEGWAGAGLPVDLGRVQTNFVQVDVGALGLSSREALARLEAAGVLLSGTVREGVIRALTHLDVEDADVERALELVPRALSRHESFASRAVAS
jgi:threonine aldolase